MQQIKIILALSLLLMGAVSQGQQDLSGVWEGVLVVAPGTEIDVQFSFESDGSGGYTGQLDAPDQPSLTAVPLDSVTVEDDSLSVAVGSVSGQYTGTVFGDAINGIWTQQGQSFELNLRPYEEAELTAENFALIEGTWVGSIRPVPTAEMTLTIVLEFNQTAEGGYEAFLASPDQGAQDIPVDSFNVEDNELTLQINAMRLEIVADIAADQLSGTFNQAGRELPISLQKGDYERDGLTMPALTFARLQGPWHGEVGGLTVVIRVEQSGDNYNAFLDSPDQGASDIPVSTLALEGDALTFTITAAGVEYSGELGADEIVGTWNQAGQSQPLTLERGPYVPGENIDTASRQRLEGSWQGTVNATELIFAFQNQNAVFSATLSIPAMGASGLALAQMQMQGDTLSFTVPAIQANFSGTVSDTGLSGQWTRAGNTSSLELSRTP